MQRIRVLQLITGLATDKEMGGAELFAVRLAQLLDKERFASAVIGLWEYDSDAQDRWISILQSEDVFVDLLAEPTGRLFHDLRRAFASFWTIVSEFKPDIINSHSDRGDVFNTLIHILHPTHPRSVRTMHTDQPWLRTPRAGAVFFNLALPLMFDYEMAISEAVCQLLDKRLLARLIGKKAVLCYNGIDAAIFGKEKTNAPPLPHTIPDYVPHIGIIGRLTEQKGHSDLFKALCIVLRTHPAHLLVTGSGALEPELRLEASHLGIQDFVHFLGNRSDVLDILPHLDILVSASLWEGFPTVMLEAMAMRTPVIATDVSGSRELVKTGETGILVPTGNPEELAKALLAVLENPEKAQAMAENAWQLTRQFNIQNTTLQYAQIYKQIKLAQGPENSPVIGHFL
jgi:glycosyltransferase involved in cell wall biosynthesis